MDSKAEIIRTVLVNIQHHFFKGKKKNHRKSYECGEGAHDYFNIIKTIFIKVNIN